VASEQVSAAQRRSQVTIAAQRDLLRARRPDDVPAALARAVTALGGTVVDGDQAGDEVLQLDLGLGIRPPCVAWADPDGQARADLDAVLPGLVVDALPTARRLLALRERVDATTTDEATGALHAPATARLVARAPEGAVVVALAPDAPGQDPTAAALAAELQLRDLADAVRAELDVDERLGRLDGDALVVVLPRPDPGRAADLVTRVTSRWSRTHPRTALHHHAATVSSDQRPDLVLHEAARVLHGDGGAPATASPPGTGARAGADPDDVAGPHDDDLVGRRGRD
jgi:hypothetical protein